MNIIKATVAHSKLISEIGKKAFLHAHGKSAPKEDIAAFLNNYYTEEALFNDLSSANNLYYIIYSEAQAVGFSKIILNEASEHVMEKNITKLDRIYLLPEYHGKNLGASLFNHTMELSKKQGQLGIWLYVWTENEKALRFYKKSGFQIVGSHDYQISETHTNPNYILFLKY
ncbi:N-acetyltransferase [Cellulophaga sp. E6(2014)]|uniref:GNAT family N-acetyltransferase n=1 Tax=Cellulophaga sp. E6(2014) TaxID=1495334 RepID=UPI00051D6CA7|nr:N-acetyltransferase [Cellulophaga sp. E6(2014)]KGK29344.1 transcriptional regulator [Cellulophaga sp. E6(2014)]